MASSDSDSNAYYVYFTSLHKYELLMEWGESITGIITGIEDDWFYIKIGKRTRQFYYWDVNTAWELEE